MDLLTYLALTGFVAGFGLIGLGLVVGAARLADPLDIHYRE